MIRFLEEFCFQTKSNSRHVPPEIWFVLFLVWAIPNSNHVKTAQKRMFAGETDMISHNLHVFVLLFPYKLGKWLIFSVWIFLGGKASFSQNLDYRPSRSWKVILGSYWRVNGNSLWSSSWNCITKRIMWRSHDWDEKPFKSWTGLSDESISIRFS